MFLFEDNLHAEANADVHNSPVDQKKVDPLAFHAKKVSPTLFSLVGWFSSPSPPFSSSQKQLQRVPGQCDNGKLWKTWELMQAKLLSLPMQNIG